MIYRFYIVIFVTISAALLSSLYKNVRIKSSLFSVFSRFFSDCFNHRRVFFVILYCYRLHLKFGFGLHNAYDNQGYKVRSKFGAEGRCFWVYLYVWGIWENTIWWWCGFSRQAVECFNCRRCFMTAWFLYRMWFLRKLSWKNKLLGGRGVHWILHIYKKQVPGRTLNFIFSKS